MARRRSDAHNPGIRSGADGAVAVEDEQRSSSSSSQKGDLSCGSRSSESVVVTDGHRVGWMRRTRLLKGAPPPLFTLKREDTGQASHSHGIEKQRQRQRRRHASPLQSHPPVHLWSFGAHVHDAAAGSTCPPALSLLSRLAPVLQAATTLTPATASVSRGLFPVASCRSGLLDVYPIGPSPLSGRRPSFDLPQCDINPVTFLPCVVVPPSSAEQPAISES
ncbi:hypothetical protein GLAREA_10686 [Glarea lozoyensis ATCC 20868]|uniref:Uncharacterized protein n=1 Tax=Glarea lozoyensis (strain ATCC 20868 / MF5171) TaxID=1116229 RepID=S3DSP2_GLAL2|nr:uncharacterized protein GLAREA_10686 [Glarea lozoyensis ATCC 20868]EPE34991.1 hypothetical protein GLAREA_10686 [Glarea lozoyensis ATCC 20868]